MYFIFKLCASIHSSTNEKIFVNIKHMNTYCSYIESKTVFHLGVADFLNGLFFSVLGKSNEQLSVSV